MTGLAEPDPDPEQEPPEFALKGMFFLYDGGNLRDNRNFFLDREFTGIIVQYTAGDQLDKEVTLEFVATKRGVELWRYTHPPEMLLEDAGEIWCLMPAPAGLAALRLNDRATVRVRMSTAAGNAETSLEWGIAIRKRRLEGAS